MTDKHSFMRDDGPVAHRNGYPLVPLDPNGKKPVPTYRDWPNNPLSVNQYVHRDPREGLGVILGYGEAPLTALDFDLPYEKAANAVRRGLLMRFPVLKEALFRVGKAPKFAIIARAAESGYKKAFTPWFSVSGGWMTEDGTCGRLEVLNRGQQVAILHIHPETRAPYRYEFPEGDDPFRDQSEIKTPLNTDVSELPVLTHEMIDAILTATVEILDSIKMKPVAKAAPGKLLTTAEQDLEDELTPHRSVGLSIAEMRQLFEDLDWDFDSYDPWIEAGMRICHETSGSPEGLDLWSELSSRSGKFKGDADCRKHWVSFRRFTGHALTMWPLARRVRKNVVYATELSDTGLHYRVMEIFGDRLAFFPDTGASAVFDKEQGRWVTFAAEAKIATAIFDVIIDGLSKEAENETNEDRRAAILKYQAKCKQAPSAVQDRIIKLLKRVPAYNVRRTDFDENPKYLGVKNGVVNLETMTLEPNTPDKRVLFTANVDFDPAARCPLWDKSFALWFKKNPEMIPYLYKVFGQAITGENVEAAAYFFVGGGANGKSVCLDTLYSILGDYSTPLSAATITKGGKVTPGGTRSDLAALVGRRFAVLSETSEQLNIDSAAIKSLTTRDPQAFRVPYAQEQGELRPAFTMFIGTNYPPIIDDDGFAIWRRIKLVHFKSDFVRDPELAPLLDKKLTDKLIAEGPGILNRILEGLAAYRKEGLKDPKEVADATARYRDDQDIVGAWIEGYLVKDENSRLSTRNAYESFRQAQLSAGEKFVMSQRALTMRLAKRLGDDAFKKSHGIKYLIGYSLAGAPTFDEDEPEKDPFA